MKKIKSNSKVVVIAVAVFMLIGGAILAYLTSSEQTTNVISPGVDTSEIQEDFDPPEELVQGANTYQKAVRVKNTSEPGAVDDYVRVMVKFSDSDIAKISGMSSDEAIENAVFYAASVDGGEDISDGTKTVIHSESHVEHLGADWEYIQEDENALLGGYYYYKKALTPGQSTTNLFNYIRTYFADENDVKPYDVYVYAESVQTLDKNGNAFVGADPWKQAWTEFLERK